MHYSDQQLYEMLESDELELASRELAHLEDCNTCRSRLAALSGEGAWLNDWMDSVGAQTSEHAHTSVSRSSASSIVIAVDSSDEMNKDIQCDSVRLDFLGKATHPELLGRLGRYDIERLIGMGGYGIVFKARDSELNRVVAIKVLAPHLMNSGPARQRFAREAQASAAVVHDHVVPIYDVVADSGISYFVMQFISGESLQERVDRLGPLPTEDVLRIGAQIASGLQAAHEQGLIHRDVKPGNVLLEDTVNRVMISDFGLARASDDASLTRSGTITGTPHYMSPEQARGQAIDARSDLFSLGSVIYFMCTGRSPFRAPQMMAVLNRICHEPYRPIEEINPNVPYELTKIVDRLLNKKPDGRFESAEDVRSQFQKLLSDYQSGKLRPRRLAAYATLRSARNLAIAGTLLLLATVALVAMAYRNSAETAPQDPAMLLAESDSAAPPKIASVVESKTETWALEPVERLYANMPTVDSFGGEALERDLVTTTSVVELLEQSATYFQNSNAGGATWDREMSTIQSMLMRLESELGVSDCATPETCVEEDATTTP
jgi:serine/threonine protein kinase